MDFGPVVEDLLLRFNAELDFNNEKHLSELINVLKEHKISENEIKRIVKNLIVINELDFTNKKDYKDYRNQHKLRQTTKVTVGNTQTTVGDLDAADKKKPIKAKQQVKTAKPVKNKVGISDPKKLRNIDRTTVMNVLSGKAGDKKTGVGLGTEASRAGEAAVHFALTETMNGKDLKTITAQLIKYSKTNKNLNSAWVKSSIACTKKINSLYDGKIKEVIWDTPAGRKLIDTEGHGTSSDLFVKLKSGERVGISLKKDGNVFLANDGYARVMSSLENKLKSYGLDDKSVSKLKGANIKYYNKLMDNAYKSTISVIGKDIKNFSKATKKIDNYEKYAKVLQNPKKLLSDVASGKSSVNQRKAYAKVLKIYNPKLESKLRVPDKQLTQKLLKTMNGDSKLADGMKKYVLDGMHLESILGLDKNKKLDKFITVYGEGENGIELSKEVLIRVFGNNAKKYYDNFLKAKNDNDKDKYKKELMKTFIESMYIDFKDGAKNGIIKIKHDDGTVYPLFTIRARARGIGNSPVMEIHQTSVMTKKITQGTFTK